MPFAQSLPHAAFRSLSHRLEARHPLSPTHKHTYIQRPIKLEKPPNPNYRMFLFLHYMPLVTDLLYDNGPIHYALAVSKPIKQPLSITKVPLATKS